MGVEEQFERPSLFTREEISDVQLKIGLIFFTGAMITSIIAVIYPALYYGVYAALFVSAVATALGVLNKLHLHYFKDYREKTVAFRTGSNNASLHLYSKKKELFKDLVTHDVTVQKVKYKDLTEKELQYLIDKHGYSALR